MRATRSHQSCEISYVLFINVFVMPRGAACPIALYAIYMYRMLRALFVSRCMCASDVLVLSLDEQCACRGMVPLAKCAQLIWAVRAVSIYAVNESAPLT